MRRTAAAAALLALASALAPSAAASAGEEPQLFWRWTDGRDDRARVFDASRYRDPEDLPRLRVTAEPAVRGLAVRLQFRDGTRWRDDDLGFTDASGRAEVSVNPICPDGRWCTAGYDYRLLVDGRASAFRLRFTR